MREGMKTVIMLFIITGILIYGLSAMELTGNSGYVPGTTETEEVYTAGGIRGFTPPVMKQDEEPGFAHNRIDVSNLETILEMGEKHKLAALTALNNLILREQMNQSVLLEKLIKAQEKQNALLSETIKTLRRR